MGPSSATPVDVDPLSDVTEPPFMCRQNLRDDCLDKMFAISGNDLDHWTRALCRPPSSAGTGPGDAIQIPCGCAYRNRRMDSLFVRVDDPRKAGIPLVSREEI